MKKQFYFKNLWMYRSSYIHDLNVFSVSNGFHELETMSESQKYSYRSMYKTQLKKSIATGSLSFTHLSKFS